MTTREGYPLRLWAEAEKLVSDTLERIGYCVVRPASGKLINLGSHTVEKGAMSLGAPGGGVGNTNDKKRADAGKIVGGDCPAHGVLLFVPPSFSGTVSLTFGGDQA